MDVFALRDKLVGDYRQYAESFLAIRDERIDAHVQQRLDEGLLWPDPPLQLNPAFAPGGFIEDLVDEGLLHPECKRILRTGKTPADPVGGNLRLHKHQVDAIRAAKTGANYVLTTGTGAGKSLSYIVPIVDHVLRGAPGDGRIKAIVVYPMNALANSQENELAKFLKVGYESSPARRASALRRVHAVPASPAHRCAPGLCAARLPHEGAHRADRRSARASRAHIWVRGARDHNVHSVVGPRADHADPGVAPG